MRLFIVIGALLLGACGAGTAAVVTGASDGGSGGAAPAISAFTVLSPRDPARTALSFNLSAPASVELFYQLPSDSQARRITQVGANPLDLDPGAQVVPWTFELEQGLEPQPGARFKPDVLVFARIPGIQEEANEEENAQRVGLNNDPPVVHAVQPMPTDPLDPDESSGNVELRLRVSDTSSDPVDLTVEWRRAGDPPDAWSAATTAGVFPGGVETAPDPGVELSFFWNTNVDLANEEEDAFFRVTADDRTETGASRVTVIPFTIDNNEEPIAQLFNDQIISSSDELRGIPLPYRVTDAERDAVEMIFQWRRQDEGFPPLPTDPAELDALLADPAARDEHHVCSEYPRRAVGRVVTLDSTAVRLPELGGSEAAWTASFEVPGATLELMRSQVEFRTLTGDFEGAVDVVSLGDGTTALVLERIGPLNRLREIDLASGALVRQLYPARQGAPVAMDLEVGGQAVLVATALAGSHVVERVDLQTVEIERIATPFLVRDLVSLGRSAVAVSAVDEQQQGRLLLLHYGDPNAVRTETILSGVELSSLARSPLDPGRVIGVDGVDGSVLDIDIRTRLASTHAPVSFTGTRYLVPERGGAQLFLASASQLLVHDVGTDRTVGLAFLGSVAGPIRLATGPDGLRLAAAAGTGALLVAGGVQQRREIVSYDPSTQVAVVARPFDVAPSIGQTWRLTSAGRALANADGSPSTFVWDSADAGAGERIFLRCFARDTDLGPPSEGQAGKRVLPVLMEAPTLLNDDALTGSITAVEVVDLDQDGYRDLVVVDESAVAIFFQEAGILQSQASVVLAVPGSAVDVDTGDMDGDGDTDIVFANPGFDSLGIFYQTKPGVFDPQVTTIESHDEPLSVSVADVDGDGDVDLLAAGPSLSDQQGFVLHTQRSPGMFDSIEFPVSDGVVLDARSADIDQNGLIDLIASGSFGLGIYFQVSPGMYEQMMLSTELHFEPTPIDVDGDGDLDLAAPLPLADIVRVYIQIGPGLFDPVPVELGGSDLPSLVSLGAGDLDGDGDVDLVPVCVDGPRALIQSASGAFSLPFTLTDGSTSTAGLHAPVVEDLDGDGDVDLAYQTFEGPAVLLQSGRPSFDAPPLVLAAPDLNGFAIGDLDGDGDRDIVYSVGPNPAEVRVLSQEAPGVFSPRRIPIELARLESLAGAEDLDGDGRVDLRIHDGTGVRLYFQGEGLAFDTAPISLPAPNSKVADLDGDGDLDIVGRVSTGLAKHVTVHFQVAPREYESLVLGEGVLEFGSVVGIGDLDSDGDLDLVSSMPVTLFLQEQPGAFSSRPLVDSVGVGVDLVVDVDGDGDCDLLSDLGVRIQEDPGVFSGWFPLDLELPPGGTGTRGATAVSDLEGDGDIDLLVGWETSRFSGGVLLIRQLGAGVFARRPVFMELPDGLMDPPPGGERKAPLPIDLDGDGDLDLVVHTTDNLTILWGGR